MIPRISLLDELRKGGYEASLITTFNAYLPFYEDVVLRKLINAGIRHNVLMMDSAQYAVAMETDPPRMAGRRYTLIPVRINGAFHPKLIFLVGKNKGLVIIGSHNMTLAGFGFNRELTNVIRVQGEADGQGKALAWQVWQEIGQWLRLAADYVPEHLIQMGYRVKDFAPWLEETKADAESALQVLAGRPGAEQLWTQLSALVSGSVRHVIVAGAFFDQGLEFVAKVQRDLKPEQMYLAVEPKTVSLPSKAQNLPGVAVVRANALGTVDKDEARAAGGYLHAKGIFIESDDGNSVFATGSANPSRPAWLAHTESGNVELVLARVGETAVSLAKELGFYDAMQMPTLSASDWEEVKNHQADFDQKTRSFLTTGIALAEDNEILIQCEAFSGIAYTHILLLDEEHLELAHTDDLQPRDGNLVLEQSPDIIAKAAYLRCMEGDTVKADFLIHHARLIEEQARTGVQKKFREALASLQTDTPDLETLIRCVDKIIFSESREIHRAAVRTANVKAKELEAEQDAEGTLATDITETKKGRKAHRLLHTSDFTCLLDTLIYHLRIDDTRFEELDQHQRNEEEQIGADDEGTTPPEDYRGIEPEKLLKICHSKVKTLVNRMGAQLSAFSEGRQSLEKVLVRLVGVLAVLRQLRRCDGKVPWVPRGKTTVPQKERKRLLKEAMRLFEGETSLLHLKNLGEAFAESDDIARLKGLLVWLAWDCDVTFRIKKVFMESREELQKRLRNNAMLLALVQMMGNDSVSIAEARQSIGSLSSGELDWLKKILVLADLVEQIKTGGVAPVSNVVVTEPGDIAVHKHMHTEDVCVVANYDGRKVTLVTLSAQQNRKTFLADYLKVFHLKDLL